MTAVWHALAGSHYDIGRQRFVLLRKREGLEGMARNIVAAVNPISTNVSYTTDLANGPLFWLLSKVRDAQPHGLGAFLRQSPNDCLQWAEDNWPRFSNLFKEPYTTDAYDKVIGAGLGALKALHLLPVVVDGLQDLLRDQLLASRNIPQSPSEAAMFYRGHHGFPADAEFTSKKYRSDTYEHFQLVNLREPLWEPLLDQMAPGQAEGGQASGGV